MMQTDTFLAARACPACPTMRTILSLLVAILSTTPLLAADKPASSTKIQNVAARVEKGPLSGDWAQWGGGPQRNNTPKASNLPSEWSVGGFDPKTGEWK